MTDINQVEATEAATSNVETQGSNETNNAFTQEQLDRIVEDRLAKQRRALEKRYNGVDPDHYKELASAEEEKRLEDAKAKGEFEKILKETVTSKDNAINQLRTELTSVKVSKEGQPRYNDKGEPMSVDSLVSEFIQANPHFKSATPGGTSSKSNLSPNKSTGGKLDLASLDMTNPNHRKMFKEAKQKGLL